MATAVGCSMPPILVAGIVVGKEVLFVEQLDEVLDEQANNPRFSIVTVLDPVLVTIAAPVASLIATPVGFVPVETSGQATVVVEPLLAAHNITGLGGLWVKSMSEAVPAPLLATTAQPFVCQIAMPSGLVPTVMGLPSCCPNVGLAGLRSTFSTLLQRVTLTKPKGDKGPLPIWAA